ncbi:MAG: hypothetical protein JJE17_01980 [Peptostreptococcaceae bacterium]|nr:hypothetical protein [Peptostreptococcaceae bacterium]
MSKVYISEDANPLLKEYLSGSNHIIVEIKSTDQVYESISSHPDIFMCKINDEIIQSEYDLGYSYPDNVKYNGVQIGKYFIHHTGYTASKLISAVKAADLMTVHVSQGYTKCNIVAVDENSIITSDEGIRNKLVPLSLDVLLISTGNVKLKGFSYGFLGGASGRVGDSIVFNGDLSAHPDFIKISDFILSRGLKLKYFEEYQLEDIGSIIEE